MIGSRIYDGDLVYVQSCSDVDSGDIGVVLLDQSEVTIKKVIKNDHSIILMATNPKYEPKIYEYDELEKGALQIIGRVLHSKIQF